MNETIVETATLGWLEALGYRIENGVAISPGEPQAERDSYADVFLVGRLRSARPCRRVSGSVSRSARSTA